MALFKCKMCGGALEIAAGASVVECEYCGTQQTLPKLNDDKRANMYDRANHFRRNNEFDKAMGIYEQILNEDNTDAEAYWSLVLCRYGIEYVEDPASHKRIPTVNRAQFTSVFDDDNYKSALQYADGYQRNIYEEEAKAINEIQKGILAISQKEEPFDVFICYKETDNNGRRTPDSVLANDLYHQLTQEGFKVFFARITLEDKLGSAYEPYIFAALNSAKVMVVLGTKPEFFNAVWVKNEWSRYLALIKQGQKKMLIPAYKDMDPYDLPEEFSHLQAQDMSKLGFMQDLIHGIKKITHKDEPQPTTVVKETVVTAAPAANASTAPLLKRAFMFLEDEKWNDAKEYCERVLDIDPECAEAYLGKLLADLKVSKKEKLKDYDRNFSWNENYEKVIRFADENLRNELVGIIECMCTSALEASYQRYLRKMELAESEKTFLLLAEEFDDFASEYNSYKDTLELAEKCRSQAAELRKKEQSDFEKCKLLFEEYKLSLESQRNKDEQISDARNVLASLTVEYEELSLLMQEWDKLQKELYLLDERNRLIQAEIINLNGDRSRLGLFDRKRKKEISTSIDTLEKEQQVVNQKKEIITLRKEGYSSLAELSVAVESIKQEIDKQKNTVATLCECSSKAVHAELSSCAIGRRLLEHYEKLKNVKVGNYLTLGMYEWFENYGDLCYQKEDIEWLVLAVENGKALIVSSGILDYKPYNNNNRDRNITWETCTLRRWLNEDFINSVFTVDEKEMIATVTVEAHDNPIDACDTKSGNVTEDRVFLLSDLEFIKYFEAMSGIVRSSHFSRGMWDDYIKSPGWWLRTPGESEDQVTFVRGDGYVDYEGSRCDDICGIRPAMWIKLTP